LSFRLIVSNLRFIMSLPKSPEGLLEVQESFSVISGFNI
jgi:hypothetical protein